MAEYKYLLAENTEGILTITINRPKSMNALNFDVISELYDAVAAAGKDDAVKVIILTGAGEKSFVAGADVSEFLSVGSTVGYDFSQRGQGIMDAIESLEKPVIAAVNGFALGGGLELAMACTIRIASENAKVGLPEVTLGVMPGYGGTQRLARLVGKGRAMEMILTGEMIDANEAYRIGLVNKVVSPDQLKDAAVTMAKKIMKNGPYGVKLAMRSVNYDPVLKTGLQFEAANFAAILNSEDMREGVNAFLEKRKPAYKGK
jgi:enoyl-CoA hydratase